MRWANVMMLILISGDHPRYISGMLITFKNLSHSIYFCSKNNLIVKQAIFLLWCMLVFSAPLCAQDPDTLIVNTDSLKPNLLNDSPQVSRSTDTVVKVVSGRPVFKMKNRLLNTDA